MAVKFPAIAFPELLKGGYKTSGLQAPEEADAENFRALDGCMTCIALSGVNHVLWIVAMTAIALLLYRRLKSRPLDNVVNCYNIIEPSKNKQLIGMFFMGVYLGRARALE
jgi:hypothetical protein